MRPQNADTPAPAAEAGHGRNEIEMLGGSRISSIAPNHANQQDIAPHVSKEAIAAATTEYHAARQRQARQPSKRAPTTPIEQNARLHFVFGKLVEVNRLSIAALVALGADDHELAHECLGSLVADLRVALRSWDDFQAAPLREAP